MRPPETTWRLLDASKDLGHFLQVARGSPLRPWVEHLPRHAGIHVLERSLRTDWRAYARGIAAWCPAPWRPAVRWTAHLVDLPAVAYALAWSRLPAWARDDPALGRFALADPALLADMLLESEWAPVARAWRAGAPVLFAWAAHWRTLWPKERGSAAALAYLESQVRSHLHESMQEEPTGRGGGESRRRLDARMTRLFRRHAQAPAAVFCHLVLVALDLERLREGLVRRSLFGEPEGAHPWA